jgi:hypothetical protein
LNESFDEHPDTDEEFDETPPEISELCARSKGGTTCGKGTFAIAGSFGIVDRSGNTKEGRTEEKYY